MTKTAKQEFDKVVATIAGPKERERAFELMWSVTEVPDNPAANAMGLKVTRSVGANDKIIFGTGQQMGMPTITSDAKFVRGAAAQGVAFNPPPIVHPPVSLKGL